MHRFIYIFILLTFLGAAEAEKGKHRAEALIKKLRKTELVEVGSQKFPEKYSFLPELTKKINEKKPILTITYLTSSSVPTGSHVAFSEAGRKLKEILNIQTKMCMIGIESKEFPAFIQELMQKLGESGDEELGMDFCPQLFEDLNIKRVPAYVVSVCESDYVHPEECKQKYLLKGDVSMKYMLEKLAENNSYFEEIRDAL